MVYITYNQTPRTHQISFEEMMMCLDDAIVHDMKDDSYKLGTRTIVVDRVPKKLAEKTNVDDMIYQLKKFNDYYEDLHSEKNRHRLYYRFYIPKKSGGLREINAPLPKLKTALTSLKELLSGFMLADYHTAAFAYIKGRCTIDAVKKHQQWESHWFLKLDLHDFFGSTTKEFVIRMFERIYPFNMILGCEFGRSQLEKAINLCFLDGGLPQGTPISPWLTNTMMIPFDHKLDNASHKFLITEERVDRFIYTRYADDMIISCRVGFPYHNVEKYVIDTLKWMDAPFELNTKKTHYGSRSGKNWMLGVILNKNNDISVGHREKKYFEVSLVSYILSHGKCGYQGDKYDANKAKAWPVEDVRKLYGLLSYYESVEGDRIREIINGCNTKFGVDVVEMLKQDTN